MHATPTTADPDDHAPDPDGAGGGFAWTRARSASDPLAHVWQASRLSAGCAGDAVLAQPTGFGAALDAHLPAGGWGGGQLTEVVTRDPGVGEFRLVLPVLARATQAGRTAMLIAPPHVPHPWALEAHGVDLRHVLIVAPGAGQAPWAIEQAMRSAALGVVLGWASGAPLRSPQLRRLALAAREAPACTSFLFREWPALFQGATPAPLRLTVEPAGRHAPEQIVVRIVKRRGPPLERPIVLDVALHPAGVSVRVRARPAVPAARISPAAGVRPEHSEGAPRTYMAVLPATSPTAPAPPAQAPGA